MGCLLDTVATTVSLPQEKFGQLRELLAQWPEDLRDASESELRSLTGKFLNVCEVVRPGVPFVRRMRKQLGMLPVQAWHKGVRGPAGGRSPGVGSVARSSPWRVPRRSLVLAADGS